MYIKIMYTFFKIKLKISISIFQYNTYQLFKFYLTIIIFFKNHNNKFKDFNKD